MQVFIESSRLEFAQADFDCSRRKAPESVRFAPKEDIDLSASDVRFVPEATASRCSKNPLSSGKS
jgi:hypothetical protein